MSIKVKICGITNIEDARAALDAGTDYIGFNFFEKSPRYISPERAADIVRRLRDEGFEPRPVGVFVNVPSEDVVRIHRDVTLHAVQLHGDEPPPPPLPADA